MRLLCLPFVLTVQVRYLGYKCKGVKLSLLKVRENSLGSRTCMLRYHGIGGDGSVRQNGIDSSAISVVVFWVTSAGALQFPPHELSRL